MLLAAWRRDAIGRLVQKRSAEIAQLAAQGFASPAAAPATSAASPTQAAKTAKLPLYAVRWVQLPASETTPAPLEKQPFVVDLSKSMEPSLLDGATAAVKEGRMLLVFCPPSEGVLSGEPLELESARSWRFVHLVQHLLEAGAAGRVVLACPVAASSAMVAGASKAIAMEASELKIQRVFVPPSSMLDTEELASSVAGLATHHSGETDLWVESTDDTALIYTQRLEPMMEPSRKLPCVSKRGRDGQPAVYLLTGATGGLGSALVAWLIHDQGLDPSQLVLLRRSGSSSLAGDLAKCRVVEVSKPHDLEVLLSSTLRDLAKVTGIFHLAGVLDDGILSGMTEERMHKVALPKCGMLTALMKAAGELKWPLQWVLGYSSTSSLFGYAGQTNYCAANALLDHYASFGARPERLPEGDRPLCRVIAVNWGPWGEAGMAKVGTKAYEQAVKEGDTPLSTAVALRCLGAALRAATQAQPSALQFCACDVNWPQSQWSDLPVLEYVTERAQKTSDASKESGGAAKQVDGAPDLLVEKFMVEHTKGSSWKRIQNKSLHQLGLDSLEIVQLRNAFNKQFNVNVPLSAIADSSQKVVDIAAKLVAQVSQQQ